MAWAVDTNVLKWLMQRGTPQYTECQKAIAILNVRGDRVSTFSQCAIEFWNFLTRPSDLKKPGLGLSVVQAEIELRKVEYLFGIHADTAILYDEWRRIVIAHEVKGKQVHDARIAASAHMHGITHLLTYNMADFKRYPFLTAVHPKEV